MCSSSCFSPVFPLLEFFLCMWIVFFSISLRIALDQCIATSRGVHYIRFYLSVSASVYNVLLVLLLSFCTIPGGPSSSHGIPPVYYSFEHNNIPSPADIPICSAIPHLKSIPLFSSFFCHYKEHS